MYVCFACIFVCIPHVCLVPKEAKKSCQMILLGTGVLEMEPRSSGRAASALNHSVVNKVAPSVAQSCGCAGSSFLVTNSICQ